MSSVIKKEETKECSVCKKALPLSCFRIHNKKTGNLKTKCRTCLSVSDKQYKLKNSVKVAEYYRGHNLLKKFNITVEEYDSMYIEQGGRCAICGKHQIEFKKRHAVDHCHDTGKIRGLLCSPCNLGLGWFFDDINTLKNSIKYLEINNE